MWLSDGFCDDTNNIEECNYDGGDCCGINVQKNFCVNCTCTGRCKYTYNVEKCIFAFLKNVFYKQTNLIVTLTSLVMEMDFVVKANVFAHLNIITKKTAPFMDVSLYST